MKNIQIYTDGSSRGNPGPGGYGVILETEGYSKEISKGFQGLALHHSPQSIIIKHIQLSKYQEMRSQSRFMTLLTSRAVRNANFADAPGVCAV